MNFEEKEDIVNDDQSTLKVVFPLLILSLLIIIEFICLYKFRNVNIDFNSLGLDPNMIPLIDMAIRLSGICLCVVSMKSFCRCILWYPDDYTLSWFKIIILLIIGLPLMLWGVNIVAILVSVFNTFVGLFR